SSISCAVVQGVAVAPGSLYRSSSSVTGSSIVVPSARRSLNVNPSWGRHAIGMLALKPNAKVDAPSWYLVPQLRLPIPHKLILLSSDCGSPDGPVRERLRAHFRSEQGADTGPTVGWHGRTCAKGLVQ